MSLLVCPEIHAAKAGRDVFAAGGNAVDAAVAAAFAQGVTNHLLCGIGGTLTIYHYDARTGRDVILNAEQTMGSRPMPASWEDELEPERAESSGCYRLTGWGNSVGPQAIMVPGFVRGCWAAFQRGGSGRISWAELLEPAIRLAADGFEVPPYSAAWFARLEQGERERAETYGVKARWEVSPGSAALMLRPDGHAYEQGDRFVQADLARTLGRIADGGGDEFYTGALGDEIAAGLAAQDALVTRDDLRGYEVEEDEPLRGSYRGSTLAAQPRSNGAQLIVMLQILDRFDLASLGHNTAAYVELVAKAMRAGRAESLRVEGRERADADASEADIVSAERADEWAERITSGDPVDLEAGVPARGTTALTAVDDEGNLVSLNHSVGHAGSGVVIDGLGFLMNGDVGHFNPVAGHADSATAGKRFFGGSPLALLRDGRPWLAVAAPGGTRIATAMLQSVLNVVDCGMDPRTAVTVPRFHSQDRQRVFMEPTMAGDLDAALSERGMTALRSRYQARPQVVMVTPDRVEGGSDPREQTSSDIGLHPQPDPSTDPAGN
jgi:gamma-glutamyltranspeptidase/glutathione hydrolase